MLRLLYFIPSWILFLVLRTVMILLGWIVIPIAALAKAYESYETPHWHEGTRTQYRFTWPWMYPWDNDEDGIADKTYWEAPNMFLQIVYWSALRNPANNLRYTPILSVKIEKEKVKYIGSFEDDLVDPRVYDSDDLKFWYVCWNGFYSNFRIQFTMFKQLWRFWIGWKIYPEDSVYDVTGHREKSAGFATQFKRLK